MDKRAYASFANPEHFGDSKSEQNGTQDAAFSQSKTDDDGGDDNNDDGSSEEDVEEIYEETGDIPTLLWNEVLLAESIRNGQVNCVPASVRHESLARILEEACYLTNMDGACAPPILCRCTRVGMRLASDC